MPEKSPRKVLFLITKGNFGGAQKYVYDLARSLPQDSFTPIVAFGESAMLKNKLEEKNIETYEIKSFKRDINFFLEINALKEVLALIKKIKPDVIHVNSSKAGGIGALAGRLCGVKNIIFTAHNWAWNENRGLFSKLLIIVAHWFTILLSHKVICVSEAIARQGRKLPFAKNKMVVIYNGIEQISFLDKNTAKDTLLPNINPTQTVVGIISELHENKGIDIALKAFEEITSEQLELVIAGTGEKKSELEILKNSLKSKNRIHFLGYVENASKYLKAFDIFLLPSRNEAFPYVLLEAGQAKIPVVATKVGGVPEVIENDLTGLTVSKASPTELAEAIRVLYQNKEKSEILAKKLKEKVDTRFSLEPMVKKTIALYNR